MAARPQQQQQAPMTAQDYKREQEEIKKRMARTANDADMVGQATLVKVVEQGEQIDRTTQKLYDIDHTLDVGDKVLNGMESKAVMFKQAFQDDPFGIKTQAAQRGEPVAEEAYENQRCIATQTLV